MSTPSPFAVRHVFMRDLMLENAETMRECLDNPTDACREHCADQQEYLRAMRDYVRGNSAAAELMPTLQPSTIADAQYARIHELCLAQGATAPLLDDCTFTPEINTAMASYRGAIRAASDW